MEALPIPIPSIVGSKLFCMYIQNLFHCLLLTLPIGSIDGFSLSASPMFYLQYVIYYLPFILAFISISACPTHCTLSFEGKNFWILKSLPINGADLINGKIMSYIKLIIPFILVHVIIVFLNIMSFSELNFIPVLVLIPIIYVFFSAVVGVLLDLKFPMFDWTSEEAVVKQKITTPISMVVNMLSVGVPVGLLIFFPSHRWIILISSTVLLVIIAILLHKILIIKVNNLLAE